MNMSLFIVLLANLLLIGSLPRVFFRRDGQFNAMWFVTALPIALSAVGLILVALDWVRPWVWTSRTVATTAAAIATLLAIAALGLQCFTLGTHRIPLALWHQDNDAPRNIVTWGAYRRIRHPFYASFLLALFAIALAAPHVITLVAWLYSFVILSFTAAREERFLAGSEFGEEYRSYMKHTGRFFPYLGHIPND